jgi:hypothetical protein
MYVDIFDDGERTSGFAVIFGCQQTQLCADGISATLS